MTYEEYAQEVQHYFHQPDLEALQICLSVATSRILYPHLEPVWLMVVGASGSGKTTMIAASLEKFPGSQQISTITSNTLLSGVVNKRTGQVDKSASLLLRLPKVEGRENYHTGMLVFPDFSTITSLSTHTRAALQGELRRVADGGHEKDIGVPPGKLTWEGHVNCIALMTEQAEEAWRQEHELGERFVAIRWARPDGRAVVKHALSVSASSFDRRRKLANLAQEFVDLATLQPLPTPANERVQDYISLLSDVAAHLRNTVKRSNIGFGEVERTSREAEVGTRIGFDIQAILLSRAAIFRRTEIDASDLAIARRITFDSIQPLRMRVIKPFLAQPTTELTISQLCEGSSDASFSIQREVDDLISLGILNKVGLGETRLVYQASEQARAWFEELKTYEH